MQRRVVGRGLGAVLFTDIVGSTAIAAEMGNIRWAELVSRHHRLIRRHVRRFGGREQDTAGDGFFVTFERPVDAIRCAVAAAEAVRSIGIEIRAGVTFGQLESVEGKAGGLIVNTAARVMSVAGPGEVLVPASVVEIVPGAGISFADHGVHRLKGIGGEIRIFEVTEVDGRAPSEPLDDEQAAERRRAVVPTTSRRAWFVAGGLAAAVLALVAIWFVTREEALESITPARSLVELDPETGSQRQRIVFSAPGRPEVSRWERSMAAGQGAVWTEDPTSFGSSVLSVDPEHGDIRRIGLGPYSFSLTIATGFDAVWVALDRLIRINPATLEHRSVLRIPLPSGGGLGGTSLAVDRAHLWIGTTDGLLLRVDPSGTVTAERTVTDSIQLLAVGGEGVWVVDQFAGVVIHVDPQSLRTIAEVPFTGNLDAIAAMGSDVWAIDFTAGLLSRISTSQDRIIGQERVSERPTSLAVGLGAVWLTHQDGTITKVDPVTLQAATIAHFEGPARAIAVDEARESLWVEVNRE
jgi:class 3 adenylate cyclase